MTVPDGPRPSTVVVALMEHGPICESCLLALVQGRGARARLQELRSHSYVQARDGFCRACRTSRTVLSLEIPRADTLAPGVRLAEPRVARESDDPICPVCLKTIARSDRVAGRRDDLMHEQCDHGRAQIMPKRPRR